MPAKLLPRAALAEAWLEAPRQLARKILRFGQWNQNRAVVRQTRRVRLLSTKVFALRLPLLLWVCDRRHPQGDSAFSEMMKRSPIDAALDNSGAPAIPLNFCA